MAKIISEQRTVRIVGEGTFDSFYTTTDRSVQLEDCHEKKFFMLKCHKVNKLVVRWIAEENKSIDNQRAERLKHYEAEMALYNQLPWFSRLFTSTPYLDTHVREKYSDQDYEFFKAVDSYCKTTDLMMLYDVIPEEHYLRIMNGGT